MIYTTLFYISALSIIYLALSLNVIRLRWKYKVGIHSQGQSELALAIRAHANFAEYVPLCLILIALLELNMGSNYIIHALGLSLFVGRVLHPLGLMRGAGFSLSRFLGMALTFLVLITGVIFGFYTFYFGNL